MVMKGMQFRAGKALGYNYSHYRYSASFGLVRVVEVIFYLS